MKTILCLILAFAATGCAGWTKSDTGRHVALTVLTAADYAQTMKISREPDKYRELNPLMPSHPSAWEVTRHFAISYAVFSGVAILLPEPYREYWQYIGIGVEAAAVGNNLIIGLNFGF